MVPVTVNADPDMAVTVPATFSVGVPITKSVNVAAVLFVPA
jgi:hypothetical protein